MPATVTLKGTPCRVSGNLPQVGEDAPDLRLVRTDLTELPRSELEGRTTVLLTVPSVDTGVCAQETRRFNERASEVPGVRIVVASSDLPFALKRFCAAEGIEAVEASSDVRDRGFAARWGVALVDGPLAGVMARAAFVVDSAGKVRYAELVPEIASEPDYDAILDAARRQVGA